jgi:hypothetical protein
MTQLDLFGEKEAAEQRRARQAAERAARIARRDAYLASLRIDCCTGEPIPPGSNGGPQYRCGRCGTLVAASSFVFTHDRGWSGCPTETEPTATTGQTIHEAGLSALRHDDQHHPRCARPGCGHARGAHQSVPLSAPEDCRCYEYCGCLGYVAPSPAVLLTGSEPTTG